MKAFITRKTLPKVCELCGKSAELRPYGPKGEWVCFACGMKDKQAAEKQFSKRLEGVDTLIVAKPESE